MNLLVELRFNGLDYRQTMKASDCAFHYYKDELTNRKICFQKLDIFFSKYRLVLWARLRLDQETLIIKESLTHSIKDFCTRLQGSMPEVWAEINGLVALADTELLSVNVGNLQSRSETRAGKHLVELDDTQHYWREMGKNKVLVDNGQREKHIRQLMASAALDLGGEIVSSPVMNEVVVAAEQPVLKLLELSDQLLELPEQLVMIVMEKCKCFAIRAEQDKLLNTAICICNQGCQVPDLVAILTQVKADYSTDLRVSIDERLLLLSELCYLSGLGSYQDKQKRLQKIVLTISDQIDAGENVCTVARQASEYAKLDLTTKTCSAFPEFLGHMGAIIAEGNGASEMVASAIIEHWCPGKYSRKLPHTLVGALLGLADRLDDICGHYHQGEFRLSHYRRVKTWFDEMIEIFDSVGLDVSMTRLLKFSLSLYESQRLVPWREKDLAYLLKVFSDRLFSYLLEKDYPEPVAAALISVGPDNVFVTLRKAEIMIDPRFSEEIEYCAEVCKVLDRTCAQDFRHEEAAREFLEQPEEKDLYEVYVVSIDAIKDCVVSRRFDQVIEKLAKFKMPVSRFIGAVDLDTIDQPVKCNRLNLLAEIRQLFHMFADFSLL